MTTRWMRLYYFALFGAIGGLIAWQISNLLGLSFTPNIYLSEVIVGGLMGLVIGLLLGLAEGLLTLNFIHALRSGFFGGLLGLAGGAIGLPLGEVFFQTSGALSWSRPLGWGLFGLLTGLARMAEAYASWGSLVFDDMPPLKWLSRELIMQVLIVHNTSN